MIPFKVDLSSKVAVITGGGGVLCSIMAEALAECGAKVAILDLKAELAEKTAEQIKSKGFNAIGLDANVLDIESLKKAERKITELLGPCDILINGAGGNHPKGTTSNEFLTEDDLKKIGTENFVSFFDLTPEGIKFVFDLNFLGTLLPTQIFSRKMAEKKNGVIINISSMNAFCPLTKIPAYSGAKAAVSNFTQWLAVHFSKLNIRVNAIAPGFFITKQNEALLKNSDGSFTARANKILNMTPIGRFGKPEELLGALLWLADDKSSSFVSGVVVPVDGGFSAYSGV
ncbi:MAG TPA: SDR family oxidoreductase [Victivallales bacterium]|nr:SDR family oxidoreductase [Victivallales bacterium]HPO89518.1 SDR family oxidoreductase [Victivallales bacterium]HRU00877.1 SDR family oxidoreductase [Victivallales bacterium]